MHDNDLPDDLIDAPDLLVPPHLLARLFDLLSGTWYPDASEQQAMDEHLSTCSFCRVGLIILLSVSEAVDRENGEDGAAAHALLERWTQLHRKLEQREKER